MKLTQLPEEYVICRLVSDDTSPDWILDDSNDTLSFTNASQEQFFLCSREKLRQENISKFELVEDNWALLTLENPPDFEGLTRPLEGVGIPIVNFTKREKHFILIKRSNLEQAIKLWNQNGHIVCDANNKTSSSCRTRDGPAETFEIDPMAHFVDDRFTKSPAFFLFLPAGWPPDLAQLALPYSRFRRAVEECWNSEDLVSSISEDGKTTPAPVYLYQLESLHITVATFFRRPKNTPFPDENEQKIKIEAWTSVLQKATQMEDWPSTPLKLCVDSCQIGSRAGILLWKETTGGIDAMRRCFKVVTEQLNEQNWFQQYPGVTASALDIPDIIHSTFLRFYSVPKTPGLVLQKRFCEKVACKLSDFFPEPITIPMCKLVRDRTPFLLIPHDEQHVFTTSFFSMKETDRFVSNSLRAEKLVKDYQQTR